MWRLFQTATQSSRAPSSYFPELDEWSAYQFDAAVIYLGTTVSNLVQEIEEKDGKHRPRYTVDQLIDPDFRVGMPSAMGGEMVDIGALRTLEGITFDEVN